MFLEKAMEEEMIEKILDLQTHIYHKIIFQQFPILVRNQEFLPNKNKMNHSQVEDSKEWFIILKQLLFNITICPHQIKIKISWETKIKYLIQSLSMSQLSIIKFL